MSKYAGASPLWVIEFKENKALNLRNLKAHSERNPIYAIISQISKSSSASEKFLNTTGALELKALESLFKVQEACKEIHKVFIPKNATSTYSAIDEVKRMEDNLRYLSQIIKAIHDLMQQLGLSNIKATEE